MPHLLGVVFVFMCVGYMSYVIIIVLINIHYVFCKHPLLQGQRTGSKSGGAQTFDYVL